MTTWRYVMALDEHQSFDRLTIRELYTNEDGSFSWSDPVRLMAETVGELAADFALMARALDGQVLDLTQDPPRLVESWSIYDETPPTDG